MYEYGCIKYMASNEIVISWIENVFMKIKVQTKNSLNYN